MSKKTVTISISVILVILVGVFAFTYINKPQGDINSANNDINKIEQSTEYKEKSSKNDKTIEFLKSVHGLKIENVELINNPVGFDGVFLAPKESIRKGVDYFLKESENDKIDKVNIDIGKGYIKAKMDYKITKKITTPIEVKIIPSLNKNKDLLLTIDDVKFLDLNVAKWIVDIGVKNFVKDWFSKDSEMMVEFNEGNVIIDKSNFKSITLNGISIDSKELKLDMMINLEELISE